MEIKKVGVLGCGQMGSGIAQIAATAGFEIVTREIEQRFLDKGLATVDKYLSKAVKKDKMTAEDKDAALGRITGTLELEDLADCDLVIEAVIEDLAIKNEMFSALDKICKAETILTSNTSSLSIMSMAASTARMDRFCGLHFFNPVQMMQLVEVVKTIVTSRETIEACTAFGKAIGKTPILSKDIAGFTVNLLLVPLLMDAMRAVENGVASIEDIDTGMKLGCAHPMGPLMLNDLVGLDTMVHIGGIMYKEYKDPKYAAPPLVHRMVAAGYLGMKTKKGFYDYSGEKPVPMDLGI
jgi:3-hydroxybutyryl-CoA dehydrogenase